MLLAGAVTRLKSCARPATDANTAYETQSIQCPSERAPLRAAMWAPATAHGRRYARADPCLTTTHHASRPAAIRRRRSSLPWAQRRQPRLPQQLPLPPMASGEEPETDALQVHERGRVDRSVNAIAPGLLASSASPTAMTIRRAGCRAVSPPQAKRRRQMQPFARGPRQILIAPSPPWPNHVQLASCTCNLGRGHGGRHSCSRAQQPMPV